MEQSDLFQNERLKNLYVDVAGISKYFFFWIYPLIEVYFVIVKIKQIGKKRALNQQDIPNISEQDRSRWNFINLKRDLEFGDRSSSMMPFCKIIWNNYKYQLFVILTLHLISSLVLSLNPLLVNLIVQLFENDRPNYTLFLRAYIMFIGQQILLMIINPAQSFLKTKLQIKINGALKGLIFDKTLRVTYPIHSQSEMLNLYMVDIQQITSLIDSSISAVLIPLQLFMKTFVYFRMLGISAFVGMVGLVFQFLCNMIYAFYYAKKQVNIMKAKDSRMSAISELIFGIINIKQNGYFKFFSTRIADRRNLEMYNIRDQKFLNMFNHLVSGCLLPIAVIYFTFKYFEIFTLANLIAVQLNYFYLVDVVNSVPSVVSSMLVGGVSIKRLMNFLRLREHEEQRIDSLHIPENIAIQVKNASFKWNTTVKSLNEIDIESTNSTFTLENISFQIKKGESVLFSGKSGSGKTSLMHAILGELYELNSNKFQINGSICLAQQEPFLQQDTIISNIIQQDDLDRKRLMKILDITQLIEEIQDMQSGINTDIGENGSTLSGGQRKRIHLCRTLYQNKEIYLLDCPLSSLDPRVSKQLAQRLIKFFKSKTLVIFDISTQYWNQVDRVFVLEEGKIVKEGNFHHITQSELILPNDMVNLIKTTSMKSPMNPYELYQTINKKAKNTVQAEDRQKGNIPRHVFRMIYVLFGKWTVFVICGVLSFIAMALNLYYQSYLSNITRIETDEDATDEQRTNTANEYLLIFPLLFGGRIIIGMIRDLIFMLCGISASLSLHTKIINNLLKASVQKFYNVTLASRIKNRLSSDVQHFDMNMDNNLSSLYDGLFQLSQAIIGSFFFSTVYTYPAQLIFVYLVYYISKSYLKSMIELFRLEALSKSPMLNYFQEIIQGIIYFRHCSDTEVIKTKFFETVDVQLQNMMAANALLQWFHQTTNILFILVYTSVLILNYQDLNLNEQQASIALYISISLSQSLFTFIRNIQKSYSHMIFFQRCDYLMNQIPNDDEFNLMRYSNSENPQDYNDQLEIQLASTSSTNQINAFKTQALVVLNLFAKYRVDSDPVLKNISFSIEKREKIAIIGRTGSGKTSLIQCITRIVEFQSGSISCFGGDYNDQSIDEIRQNFSVISQDPFIFEGTIHQNIDPMGVYESEAEILGVIGEQYRENINLLNNMQDQVGQQGINLSLGERQILVILRVMLQRRKIVILDECTGSLDQKSSLLINNMLNIYLKDKTVINVTHDFDTIKELDKVILIESGAIKIIGTKDQALKYYRNQQ